MKYLYKKQKEDIEKLVEEYQAKIVALQKSTEVKEEISRLQSYFTLLK